LHVRLIGQQRIWRCRAEQDAVQDATRHVGHAAEATPFALVLRLECAIMRNLIIVAIGLVTAGLFPNAASALHKVSIGGTHSRGELKAKCDAVGGSCANCGGKTGSYACDNPSAGTSVSCTSGGKCTGWVPRSVPPGRRLGGILTPPTAGVEQTGGGQAGTGTGAGKSGVPGGVKGTAGFNQPGSQHPLGGGKRH
jgi:hypothetical protein